MVTSTKQHLSNNKGDANVSKMTLIAIVFVVGAILLVLTTSAFRNPINRWFEKVTTGWFANENGMFTQSIDSNQPNDVCITCGSKPCECYKPDPEEPTRAGDEGLDDGL